jgi:hypothetical protein
MRLIDNKNMTTDEAITYILERDKEILKRLEALEKAEKKHPTEDSRNCKVRGWHDWTWSATDSGRQVCRVCGDYRE